MPFHLDPVRHSLMRYLHAAYCLFAGLTLFGCESEAPCAAGLTRACEGTDDSVGELCGQNGEWSGECVSVERECDEQECDEHGFCRSSRAIAIAGGGAWNMELEEAAIVVASIRILEPGQQVEVRRVTRDGFQDLPARKVFETNLGLADLGLRWHGGQVALTTMTLAANQRADVRFDLFDSELNAAGGDTYVDQRGEFHAAPAKGGWSLFYYDRDAFQSQHVAAGGKAKELVAFERDQYRHVHRYAYVWTGERHVVVASDDPAGTTRLLQWDEEGALQQAAVPLEISNLSSLALAWNGSEFGLLWVEASDTLYFATLSTSGTLSSKQLLAEGAPQYIELQATDQGWLAAWAQADSGDRGIFVQRISADAEQAWQPLKLAAGSEQVFEPRIRVDAQEAFLGWVEPVSKQTESVDGQDQVIKLQQLKECL